MNQSLAKKKSSPPLTVAQLLESQKSQIMAALPKHMDPNRMARIALTEFRRTPKLQDCDPMSFLGAIIQCSQIGLEPGSSQGHVYLVPFFNGKRKCYEVQVIPGYKGFMELARRSGAVSKISARCVYEKDTFNVEYGASEKLTHIPYTDGDPGPMIKVYAVAVLKDGNTQFEVMTMDQIKKVEKASKSGNVWKEHFDEMARKTAVRRLYKYLPSSAEMSAASQLYDDNYSGVPQENFTIIDKNYKPEPIQDPLKLTPEETQKYEQQTREMLMSQVQDVLTTAAKEMGKEEAEVLQMAEVTVEQIEKMDADQLNNLRDVINDLRTKV